MRHESRPWYPARMTVDRTSRALRSLLLLVCLVVAGCNWPSQERWAQLSTGMTEPEVRSLLGDPSSRTRIPIEERERFGYAERWQYGDNLSSLATGAAFPDQPDQRVWVVFFDAAGTVVSMREPTHQ